MSPEELHILRRRLHLTQAQFAERLGVSKSLIESVELGRRRLTEARERDIARLVGGVRLAVPEAEPPRSQHVFSRDNYQETGIPAGSGDRVKESVRPAPSQLAAQTSATRAGQVVKFDRCAWPRCSGQTPVGMFYCAQHMALAQIEGRPTQRATATGPLHADFVREHNAASQRRAGPYTARYPIENEC